MKIFHIANSVEPVGGRGEGVAEGGEGLLMSHLIWIYIFAPFSLKYQYDVTWEKHFPEMFGNVNFVVCF